MGYRATHRKTRVAYPKKGYFESLEAAVEFAKRRDDDVRAWNFGQCPVHDYRKIYALDPALKIAVRQLWSHEEPPPPAPQPPSEPPEPEMVPSDEVEIPRAPRVPSDAPRVTTGQTIPSDPMKYDVVTPSHTPTPPPPIPKKRRRRRKKSD